jgi:uncharacterized membrane protein
MSLIRPEQTWLLLACILAGAACSIGLEQRQRWAARIGGPVLALGLAMILSNLRVLPLNAPAYDVIDDYFVPAAIPLLLLRANLRRILRETGPMFAAFHVAAAGTLMGAILAAGLFSKAFPMVPEVTGIMGASYIGGGVNFVAVRQSYDVPAELSNPLIVADNFIMAAMFGVLIVLAGSPFLRRHYPHPHSAAGDQTDSAALASRHWKRKEIALLDLAQAMAIAVTLAALGIGMASLLKGRIESRLLLSMVSNPYIWITVLTVTLTTAAHRWTERIQGGDELGMFFLYLFFFVLGVRADLIQVIRNIPVLFLFCLVMAVTNLVVTLGLGRLFRLNLEELLLGVNATLGGAPSAAAMAISRGWSQLVLPGLLIGIWGYAIGTPLGILIAETVRKLL